LISGKRDDLYKRLGKPGKNDDINELKQSKEWLKNLSNNKILEDITNLKQSLMNEYNKFGKLRVKDETGKDIYRVTDIGRNLLKNLTGDNSVTKIKNSLLYHIEDLDKIIEQITLMTPVYSETPPEVDQEALEHVKKIINQNNIGSESQRTADENREDQAKIKQMNDDLDQYNKKDLSEGKTCQEKLKVLEQLLNMMKTISNLHHTQIETSSLKDRIERIQPFYSSSPPKLDDTDVNAVDNMKPPLTEAEAIARENREDQAKIKQMNDDLNKYDVGKYADFISYKYPKNDDKKSDEYITATNIIIKDLSEGKTCEEKLKVLEQLFNMMKTINNLNLFQSGKYSLKDRIERIQPFYSSNPPPPIDPNALVKFKDDYTEYTEIVRVYGPPPQSQSHPPSGGRKSRRKRNNRRKTIRRRRPSKK
jgi:hypothetical protein